MLALGQKSIFGYGKDFFKMFRRRTKKFGEINYAIRNSLIIHFADFISQLSYVADNKSWKTIALHPNDDITAAKAWERKRFSPFSAQCRCAGVGRRRQRRRILFATISYFVLQRSGRSEELCALFRLCEWQQQVYKEHDRQPSSFSAAEQVKRFGSREIKPFSGESCLII